MARDFEEWLSQFRPSIANYSYYIDFDKVCDNVNKIRVELNIMNSLIGSRTIEDDFKSLALRYPEIIKCIPILIAVRYKEIYAQDKDGGYLYIFDDKLDVESAARFMKKSGLFEMIANRITHDLVDYALGIEAGLDSNGRKNRGGHLMEDLVESYIQKAGFIRDSTYFKEMYIHEIEERWNLDLSEISNDGKAEKRFDFVLKTDSMVYGIETNFYSGGGSKLNETSRSYKMLTEEAQRVDGFTFLWVTDGMGWRSARRNLRETFDAGANVYNIAELENGAFDFIYRGQNPLVGLEYKSTDE